MSSAAVIGPCGSSIPEAIAAFSQSQAVMLRNPRAVRPWQHVLDCLGGYIALAEALASNARTYCGDWNFGPADDDSRQVAYVVDALAEHWGIARPWVQDPATHAPEEYQLRLDVSKAANLLGWRCRLSIDTALQWVAGWYRSFHDGVDARSFLYGSNRPLFEIRLCGVKGLDRMKFLKCDVAGACVIDPTPHPDERGRCMRAWCKHEFANHGIDFTPMQANMGLSLQRGTIRGLHYQLAPALEAKLVRCTRGSIYDVVVDLRTGSPTRRLWYGLELSADNGRMFYVPEGCAHGCQSMRDNSEIH